MPGLQGALNSGGASSGKGSSNNGSNGRDSRNNGSSNGSSPGGAAGSIENAATLAEYLRFGRLIGESPQQVKQQLDVSGVRVQVDAESKEYLQSWEREELEAYAMFEAVVRAEASRSGGAGTSAAAKKLQRNKNLVSAAVSAEELRRGARSQYERPIPMTASQRRLARNKQNAGGLGAGMQASLEALMQEAGAAEEEGGFELVAARPTAAAGGVRLASKPSRPTEYEEFDDDEMDLDAMWAEVEAEAAAAAAVPLAPPPRQAPPRATYDQFDQLLGKPSKAQGGKTAKPSGSQAFSSRGSGSLASVGQLKDALPPRPAAPTATDRAAAQPASGMTQLNLRKAAAPVKLAAKPQASVAAREAAQRPAPPPPAPEPTLASKPARPAAPEPPAAPAAPNPPAAPQPLSLAAQPPAPPKRPATPKAQAPPRAAEQAVPPVAAKPEPRTPEPSAAQASDAAPSVVAAPAAATEEAGDVPAPAPKPARKAQPAPAQPAQPAPAAAAQAQALQEEAAAVESAPSRPQRPLPPMQRSAEQRRAANAAYGAEALLDRRVEELTVWQVNAAGVLVRNERLSGFVPTSLLAPATVSEVLAEEQKLAAAAAAGPGAAQPEQEGAPGDSLDVAARSAVRREALAAVMMGRQLSARAVNVDDSSKRVVLSERAAMSQPGPRAAPPTLEELRAAAKQLGEVVDATVVVVKPFGCFVEFAVGLPASAAEPAAGQQEATPRSVSLVGLVHASEVSWDPQVDVMQAIKAGQRVRAKIMHVDAAKARVFLSMRRTAPNPLLETLDSLVTSAGAASTAAARDGDADTRAAAAQLDQRPALGDLAEAAAFAGLLRAARGVHSVELGVRLQSRAASQSLEVFMAKNPAAGIGGAVAAAGGAASGSATGQPEGAAAAVPADARSYNLVLRKETSVQEVAVVASLGRDEVRELAAACVAELAAEAEAEQALAA